MASIADRPHMRPAQKSLRRPLRGPRLTPAKLQQRLRTSRRQHAQRARAARRPIDRNHHRLPAPVHAVFERLAPALTRPPSHRFVVRALAAILTVGGRTVAKLLGYLGAVAPGHSSSDHRLLSPRRWPSRRRARRYIAAVVARFAPHGPGTRAGADTVTEHPGAPVYGTGCHRDPVRSSHGFTAYRWGHQWVVLALWVGFPGCRRRWALPRRGAWYRPAEKGKGKGTETETGRSPKPKRAHQTPVDRLGPRLRILIPWFPDRTFVCAAEGNGAAHEPAELAAAHPQRLKFVRKFSDTAHLFEPPPPDAGQGRPRVQGKAWPKPAPVVRETSAPSVRTVAWYAGERRRVEVVTGSGGWYQSGRPLVPVRRVFVRDRTGTHREDYSFTTDVKMRPTTVIETDTGRWNLETTFPEARSYLGLETTRGRSRNTVLRAEPSLLALSTVVVWLEVEVPARYRPVRVVDWLGKGHVTSSGAITAVRRWLGVEWVFSLTGHRETCEKLGGPLQPIVLQGLAPVA